MDGISPQKQYIMKRNQNAQLLTQGFLPDDFLHIMNELKIIQHFLPMKVMLIIHVNSIFRQRKNLAK